MIKKETKEFTFDKPGVCAIAAPRMYSPGEPTSPSVKNIVATLEEVKH